MWIVPSMVSSNAKSLPFYTFKHRKIRKNCITCCCPIFVSRLCLPVITQDAVYRCWGTLPKTHKLLRYFYWKNPVFATQ